MKILSLFDGLSCGMIAMKNAGVQVDRYVAYEIDKYAIKVSTHNFPEVEQKGDVFTSDFTEYEGFDWLIGGSPCTYWSIAQKNNRETEASGLGWELFSQYVRALHEAKPKYFIYENNKSMAKAIRDSIRETFGFEEICINSALLSAQNRQRYYWVGKRNEDGTYSKVDVQQPEDRGILLRDVLDGAVAWQDKAYAYTTRCQGAMVTDTLERHRHTMVAEPINLTVDGKSHTVKAQYFKNGMANFVTNGGHSASAVAEPVRVGYFGAGGQGERIYDPNAKAVICDTANHGIYAMPVRVGCMPSPDGTLKGSQANRVYSVDGKAVNQVANGGGAGAKTGLYAMPVCVAERGRYDSDGNINQHYEVREDGKTNVLTTVSKDNQIAEPCCMRYERTEEAKRVRKDYEAGLVHHGFHELSELHPRTDGKSNTLSTVLKDNPICDPVPQYATPCEWSDDGIPTKAISGADGKTYTVYCVQNGQITIKGKTYPIKLIDGYYIIRKLTVSECKRLQTVPEWYDFSVISNSQAYKCLGNGWTCDVITHLINACLK